MKNLLIFLMLFGTMCMSKGQAVSKGEVRNGLYDSPEDLIIYAADTVCNLRKIADTRVDALVDRCWFRESGKGMIKTSFAVIFDGQLYISEQFIQKHLSNRHSDAKGDYSHRYYRVLHQGRYLYIEVLLHEKDPDLGIVMGIMGGVVGNVVGTSITESEPILCAVAFDTTSKSLFSFRSNKDVADFLKVHHPRYMFDPAGSALDLIELQKVFRQLH